MNFYSCTIVIRHKVVNLICFFAASNYLCLERYNIIQKKYAIFTSINHASNPDNTFPFYDLEHQITIQTKKLRWQLFLFCWYGSNDAMLHMISFNQGFNLILIGKYWHKRDTITQSTNDGSYISPRLKTYISEKDDVELFEFQTLNIGGSESLS